MGIHFDPPAPASITSVLDRFNRAELAEFITAAIDMLDLAEPDPDLEANGDELDGNASEDDFMFHGHDGPGCPIADSDCCAARDDHLDFVSNDGGAGDPEDGEDERDREADNCDLEEGPDWKHDVDDADRFTRRPHLDRIRRTRCRKIVHRGCTWAEYRLRLDPLRPSRASLLRRKRGMPRSPRP